MGWATRDQRIGERLDREALIETNLLTGEDECGGIALRLAHPVAQMCHTDARDHGRVAERDRRAGEMIEEPNSGVGKNRSDVDVEAGAKNHRT